MTNDPFVSKEPQRGWTNTDKSDHYHRGSDVDSGIKAQHHTLGKGPNQAAAGNHTHAGESPVGSVQHYFGSADPSSNWFIMNGRELLRADYPELMVGRTFADGPSGPAYFILPDAQDKFLVGAGALHALLATGGAATTTLTEANLPPHAHTIDHDHADTTTTSGGSHAHNTQRGGSAGNGAFFMRSTAENVNNVGPMTADGSHDHTVNTPAHNGNSGNGAGTSTSFTNEPPYLSLHVIMRVK